jgi:hypothetical protein
VSDLRNRAFADLRRVLEGPRLSALRSSLGLAVASSALRSLERRATDAAEDRPPLDIVEEWGLQSFPASDAPSNW